MTQIAKRNKKTVMITIAIVCVIAILMIALGTFIISIQKRNDFIAAYGQAVYDRFGLAEKGAYLYFGAYEQDNDISNGKEDIAWIVLEKENDKILVISDKALDCQPYNIAWGEDAKWENCSFRKWLNKTFLNDAFSFAEQTMIADTNVSADKNPKFGTDSGNNTTDKVFLLSINEVNRYFDSDGAKKCVPTAYAIANGAWTWNTYTKGYTKGVAATCWWWLRSPGYNQNCAAYVYSDGSVDYYGSTLRIDGVGVRPALWINLDS